MDKLLDGVIKHKKIVLTIFFVLIVFSLLALPKIVVNYDLAEYLPANSMTKHAITVIEDEFGYPGTANVMLENVSLREAAAAKEKINAIPGIKSVLWLDDVTDITVPTSFIPQNLLNNYYKDNTALYHVEFAEGDYSKETGLALQAIRDSIGGNLSISGPAEDASHMRDVLGSEMLMIMLVVVPLCVLILMFASYSWIEPFLYLIVIGISVLINMGTNALFPSISFITNSIASVLQFAISMDYSLFLGHRYTEERDTGSEVIPAIITAVKKSLSAISASAMTTVAGFLALLFMQYRIGQDLGIVLAKGIGISFLCIMILLPIFIVIFHKAIDKTRHKPFIPSFVKLGRITFKFKYLLIALAIFIIVPSYLAQNNNHFLYGSSSGSSSEGQIAEERQNIEDHFGIFNQVILLIPNNNLSSEIQLANELEEQQYIREVQALVTVADPAIPRELLPDELKDMFMSDHYSRMIVVLNVDGEKPESFAAVTSLKQTVQKYYPDEWLSAGTATSIFDIKDTVESDRRSVNLFSILIVGLIILLTFRSLFLPVLLVTVIEASIWINMGVSYFQGSSLVFIGFLVVSSIQLGATIDYGILMSSRYLEFRRSQNPRDAALSALSTAGNTVLISALILSIAGFAEGFLSHIKSISDIGILLGRGAALSGLTVLILLPILFILFDPIIMKTTLKSKQSGRKGD